MEEYISTAVNFMSSIDVYILSGLGLLASLAVAAKFTKTKTDDKYIAKARDILNKVLSYLPNRKTK